MKKFGALLLVLIVLLAGLAIFHYHSVSSSARQTLLSQQARAEFEKGNYPEAEKIYREILEKTPANLNTLSNLGVALFRLGKFNEAENVFKTVIVIAPEDEFSHCTLGIVYYSEGKLDDAVNELTKALAIDPKDVTAHNYLGIVAGKKGWNEAAQKELETVRRLHPIFEDGRSNLSPGFVDFPTPREKQQLDAMPKSLDQATLLRPSTVGPSLPR